MPARPPLSLAELLPRLSREAGAQRLRRAALEAGVARALGEWLAARLASCRRDGDALELEIAGRGAAAEVERLRDEVLERLRAELGREAPARLRVRAVAARGGEARESRPRRPEGAGEPGPLTASALEEIEDPALRAQLARVAGRGGDPDRT